MSKSNVEDLSPDWWQMEFACRALSHCFDRHIVGLSVGLGKGGKIVEEVFTGFLLLHENRLMWCTAGHVIDQLGEILETRPPEEVQLHWMDGMPINGASSFPVHDRNLAR